MKPRKIKRFWLLGLVTMLLVIVGVALSILWPRLFPSSEVSDLYRRYEHNDHIRATEIHDFRINDTLAVETVLLQAATDSAWCALLLDFGTPEELIEMYKTDKDFFVREDANAITLFYIDKVDIKKFLPSTNPDSRLVIASHWNRTLCIFMTEKNNIKETIELFEIKKLKK
jgi:hypothetical protein